MSWYEMHRCVGDRVRAGRGAVIGTGVLPHCIGTPHGGGFAEDVAPRLLDRREAGEREQVLGIPGDAFVLAGSGAHETRSWVAVAAAAEGAPARQLAYEAVYPWITGMGVVHWETLPDHDQISVTAEEQDTRREESHT